MACTALVGSPARNVAAAEADRRHRRALARSSTRMYRTGENVPRSGCYLSGATTLSTDGAGYAMTPTNMVAHVHRLCAYPRPTHRDSAPSLSRIEHRARGEHALPCCIHGTPSAGHSQDRGSCLQSRQRGRGGRERAQHSRRRPSVFPRARYREGAPAEPQERPVGPLSHSPTSTRVDTEVCPCRM